MHVCTRTAIIRNGFRGHFNFGFKQGPGVVVSYTLNDFCPIVRTIITVQQAALRFVSTAVSSWIAVIFIFKFDRPNGTRPSCVRCTNSEQPDVCVLQQSLYDLGWGRR